MQRFEPRQSVLQQTIEGLRVRQGLLLRGFNFFYEWCKRNSCDPRQFKEREGAIAIFLALISDKRTSHPGPVPRQDQSPADFHLTSQLSPGFDIIGLSEYDPGIVGLVWRPTENRRHRPNFDGVLQLQLFHSFFSHP